MKKKKKKSSWTSELKSESYWAFACQLKKEAQSSTLTTQNSYPLQADVVASFLQPSFSPLLPQSKTPFSLHCSTRPWFINF